MKRVIVILLFGLAAAVVLLALRQERFARRLKELETENARLAQALAEKPDLTREQFNAVSRRLENATAFMDTVESRLTNASALLTQLNSRLPRNN